MIMNLRYVRDTIRIVNDVKERKVDISKKIDSQHASKEQERLEGDSAGGLAMRLVKRVQMLASIMIIYAGECHSKSDGSVITGRER